MFQVLVSCLSSNSAVSSLRVVYIAEGYKRQRLQVGVQYIAAHSRTSIVPYSVSIAPRGRVSKEESPSRPCPV